MSLLHYYNGGKKNATLTETEEKLAARLFMRQDGCCSNYIPDEGLIAAANVAIHLGQPLLLTGEPGCGKTEFANHLAWSLGFDSSLRFETKSTSTARDLFYYYDTLGRFHDAQAQVGGKSAIDYMTFNALGVAILKACRKISKKTIEDACGKGIYELEGPRQRSVVLVDEIDKAPRDFPNDLLTEVDEFSFRVAEIPSLANLRIQADKDLRPIVVISSNSERSLPDAFLRRCIYYNIPFPEPDQLERIVCARLAAVEKGSPFFVDSLELFRDIRQLVDGKKPSVAELLSWLQVLRLVEPDIEKNPFQEKPQEILKSMPVLLKSGDHEGINSSQLTNLVQTWLAKKHYQRK